MADTVQNISRILEQAAILFLLTATGFLCGKRKVITDKVSDGLVNIIFYIVAPSMMISSFQREYDPLMLKNFLITFAVAVCITGGSILLTKFSIRDKAPAREKVLRASVIFSNCGMISLALQESLYGSEGVFYGAAYIAVFNILFWTYGIILFGKKEDISFRKVFLNPGIAGTIVGLLLFFLSIRVPETVKKVCDDFTALNTPIAMLVIGQKISVMNVKEIISDRGAVWAVFQKLILVPLISIVGLAFFKVDKTVAMVCIIAASAPAATANTMLAVKLKQNSELSVKAVSVGTLFSLATMPTVIIIAQTLL